MDIRDIKWLINNGEGGALEFKKKTNFPEKIIKEIVAFANTRGGNLLIGVDDDGTISGLKNVDEDVYVLEKAIHDHCRPLVRYEVEKIKVNEKKSILNYTIFESQLKPHFVILPTERSKKAYIRIKDRSVQASKEMIEILRRSRRKNGLKIEFGEKEKILMSYLGQHSAITVKEFSRIAKIKKFTASKTLVWLVLGNILEIEAREEEDIFRQKI